MITLDVKFPKSDSAFINMNCIYNVTNTYYNIVQEEEEMFDLVLEEIKTKGQYISKAKSDKNGGFVEAIKVYDGNISTQGTGELTFAKDGTFLSYTHYKVFGEANAEKFINSYIDELKYSNLGIYYKESGKYKPFSIAYNNAEIEELILNGEVAIIKDFKFDETNKKVSISFDMVVPNDNFINDYDVSFLYNFSGVKYHFKTYSKPRINITGDNLDFVGINFVGTNYSFPKSIRCVDDTNQEIVVSYNGNICIFQTNKKDNFYFTLDINEWSEPNSQIGILNVFLDEVKIDRNNLISAESNISYRADKKLPSFGILSNTGNLEFNDIDGRIKAFAENNLLKSDVLVQLSIKNTLTNTQEQIGEFYTDVWDYDNDNRQVSVTLKDGLEELQDITPTLKIRYDPRTSKPTKASAFYINLSSFTPQKYRFKNYVDLDEKTKSILSTTIIQYPFMEQGTLWQVWTKLCELCGLYIYKNNLGETVCSYAYGG